MSYKQFSKDLNAHGFSYERQMVLFHRAEPHAVRNWYRSYLDIPSMPNTERYQSSLEVMSSRFNSLYTENDLEVSLGSQIPGNIYFYNPLVGGFTLTIPDGDESAMITVIGNSSIISQRTLDSFLKYLVCSRRPYEPRMFGDHHTEIVRKVKSHSDTLGALLPGCPLKEPLEDAQMITEVLLYKTYEDNSETMDLVHEFCNMGTKPVSTNLDFDLQVVCM